MCWPTNHVDLWRCPCLRRSQPSRPGCESLDTRYDQSWWRRYIPWCIINILFLSVYVRVYIYIWHFFRREINFICDIIYLCAYICDVKFKIVVIVDSCWPFRFSRPPRFLCQSFRKCTWPQGGSVGLGPSWVLVEKSVLFPLVGWLIEGFGTTTPPTTGRWW